MKHYKAGGWTPLHKACESGKTDMVKLLIDARADVNAQQDQGIRPLYSAVHFGHAETTQILVSHGADVNCTNEDGLSSLHVAAADGNAQIIKILVYGMYSFGRFNIVCKLCEA